MAEQAPLQRLDSYQYPSAHVGHLQEGQLNALDKFKKLCEAKAYYTPKSADGKPASHDDETLLRYLRARKWIPNEAFAQFKDTEDWRKENQLDKLYETIDVAEYDQTRRLYPQWTGRRDKRGIPVYVFEVAHLNSKAVSANENSASKTKDLTTKVPPKMMRLFALYENLTTFVLPLCSALPDRPYPETPVSQSNNIVDISKVGLKQFWNLKAHMQDASTLATAHYPETLDRIFIIGAPSFFPTVWSWIKRWFDPITVSKIFILSHADMKKTLEQYIEIENIPKKYGGQLDYEFGQLPNMDPAIEQICDWSHPVNQAGKKTIPTGPIKWKKSADGNLEAIAVGTENGKRRDTKIFGLRPAGNTSLSPTSADPRSTIFRTTTGLSTHPPSPPVDTIDTSPPLPGDESPKAGSVSAQGGALPDTRNGTSATRYEQQDATLGAGQLAEGTPHVRGSGDGDVHGVMEPNTVAQAPKEHPVPEPEVEAPGYVDQAKQAAGGAYASAVGAAGAAMAALGLGHEGEKLEEKSEETKEERKEDPAVDNTAEKNVEGFLRAKYNSLPEHKQ